jgi:hypothetical protein
VQTHWPRCSYDDPFKHLGIYLILILRIGGLGATRNDREYTIEWREIIRCQSFFWETAVGICSAKVSKIVETVQVWCRNCSICRILSRNFLGKLMQQIAARMTSGISLCILSRVMDVYCVGARWRMWLHPRMIGLGTLYNMVQSYRYRANGWKPALIWNDLVQPWSDSEFRPWATLKVLGKCVEAEGC